jgi:hypothetical protein
MEHGVEFRRVHLRHLALHPLPAEPHRHVEHGHARNRIASSLEREGTLLVAAEDAAHGTHAPNHAPRPPMVKRRTRDRGRFSRDRKTLGSNPTPIRRTLVSLLIRFAPPSLTAQQYDDVVRRLNEDGVFPADGLDYEICFGSEGNLKVSQVWDTQEQMEAFGQRLMPILAEMSIDPGQPEIVQVHNIIRR